MSQNDRDRLKERIDAIEESYEFMLGYAAQGLEGDAGSSSGGQLRKFLSKADEALTGLAEAFTKAVKDNELEASERYQAFIAVLSKDADASQAAIQMVMAQPSISSQIIDNLNASIHVRALLTDIFLIDEVLKPHLHRNRPQELDGQPANEG